MTGAKPSSDGKRAKTGDTGEISVNPADSSTDILSWAFNEDVVPPARQSHVVLAAKRGSDSSEVVLFCTEDSAFNRLWSKLNRPEFLEKTVHVEPKALDKAADFFVVHYYRNGHPQAVEAGKLAIKVHSDRLVLSRYWPVEE